MPKHTEGSSGLPEPFETEATNPQAPKPDPQSAAFRVNSKDDAILWLINSLEITGVQLSDSIETAVSEIYDVAEKTVRDRFGLNVRQTVKPGLLALMTFKEFLSELVPSISSLDNEIEKALEAEAQKQHWDQVQAEVSARYPAMLTNENLETIIGAVSQAAFANTMNAFISGGKLYSVQELSEMVQQEVAEHLPQPQQAPPPPVSKAQQESDAEWEHFREINPEFYPEPTNPLLRQWARVNGLTWNSEFRGYDDEEGIPHFPPPEVFRSSLTDKSVDEPDQSPDEPDSEESAE